MCQTGHVVPGAVTVNATSRHDAGRQDVGIV